MTMHKNKSLGIDVSKACLDVYCQSNNSYKSFLNNQKGIQELLLWIQKSQLNPYRIILEPSGGYEKQALHSLIKAGFPVSLVHAKRPRDFANAKGRIAKTDRLDSQLLADYGSTLSPKLTYLPSEAEQKLAALTLRRLHLVEMRKSEKNRFEKQFQSLLEDDIRESIQYFTHKIQSIESSIKLLLNSPEFIIKKDILMDVKGVAQVTASTILGLLPEIGQLNNGQIAKLVGVAPITQESGKWKGTSCIRGGRANVRKALFLAARSAVIHNPKIKAYYDYLRNQGKRYKVCMVAVMRKLLIILNGRMKNYYRGREVY